MRLRGRRWRQEGGWQEGLGSCGCSADGCGEEAQGGQGRPGCAGRTLALMRGRELCCCSFRAGKRMPVVESDEEWEVAGGSVDGDVAHASAEVEPEPPATAASGPAAAAKKLAVYPRPAPLPSPSKRMGLRLLQARRPLPTRIAGRLLCQLTRPWRWRRWLLRWRKLLRSILAARLPCKESKQQRRPWLLSSRRP